MNTITGVLCFKTIYLVEMVLITSYTHKVCKMAGMVLLVLTWYIDHRLLHIGCPGNIIKPFKFSNIVMKYSNKSDVFYK
jgi:hypothetical protein